MERTLTRSEHKDTDSRVPVSFLVTLCSASVAAPPSRRIILGNASKVGLCRGTGAPTRNYNDTELVLDVQLDDPYLSSEHAVISKRDGQHVLEDLNSKNGTRVNGDAIADATTLEDQDIIEAGGAFLLYRSTTVPAAYATDEAERQEPLFSLNPALMEQFDKVGRIAATDLTVLLGGATGVGKEVTATAIHQKSGRSGPFVPVNCGAIPENLVESQLFGHVKGAFSGATHNAPGFVGKATGGTLFLDEIAELPLLAQAKLLRVLQERECQPVGASEPHKVDLRVIAATHQSLETLVKQGRFREDLLSRLRGFVLELPNLSDRLEDFGTLTRGLMAAAVGKGVSADAMRRLLSHDWPRNIRELKQTLGTAAALSRGQDITPSDLESAGLFIEQPEDNKVQLVTLLQEHKGNISAVARAMGKARVQIRRWCTKYQLNPDDYRNKK